MSDSIWRRHRLGCSAALALVAAATIANPSQASLIGDEVTLTIRNHLGHVLAGPTTSIGNPSTIEWVNPLGDIPAVGSPNVDIVDEDTITVFVHNTAPASLIALEARITVLLTGLDWNGTGIVTGVSTPVLSGSVSYTDLVVTGPNSVLIDDLFLRLGTLGNGHTFSSFTFDVHSQHIPEPSTYAGLASLGLIGLAICLARRRA